MKILTELQLHAAFEQQILNYPFADTEELNDEHEMIFKWFWQLYEDLADYAWKYRDLNK